MKGYDFTGQVRRVLEFAREEAERLHHEYVGTEHLLLGLLRDDEGVAAATLMNLHFDPNKSRQMLEEIVKRGKASPVNHDLPYTSRAKKVLELSMREAADLNHSHLGTEHLLIGLLLEEKGIAAQVLMDQGLTADAVRDEVLSLVGDDPEATSRRLAFSTQVTAMFPEGLDALEAAPHFHKLLLENEHVRVLETRIPPGETTPLHTHRYPAAHYVRTWSHFVRRNEAGDVMLDTRETDFSRNEPQALWGTALTPHTVENVGNATLHIVSVEIKSTARHGR
jgi:mannose-6-phosphate isomerase-like protein (cupin superfamily)